MCQQFFSRANENPDYEILQQSFDGFPKDFHQPFTQHLLPPIAAEILPGYRIAQVDGFLASLNDLTQRQLGVMSAHRREAIDLSLDPK